MADLIVENGYLLTMDPGQGDFERGVVVMEGGRITEVGARTRQRAPRTIDAAGGVVLPGLVNTHGHLAMTLLRGYADDVALQSWLEDHIWPAEAELTADDIRLGSLLGCLEMIRNGTTAFADMYYHMDEVAAVVERSGLRGNLCYGMLDFGDEERAKTELTVGSRFVRDWNGRAEGRIRVTYGPHAPNTCSLDFLKTVRRRADADGTGIQIHILETETERRTLIDRLGPNPLGVLDETGILGPDVLAAHAVWLSGEDIALFARRGVQVSHNPNSNMKLASGIAPVARMISEGVRVSLGTDGCASNNNLSLFEEMKSAALVQKVHTQDPTVMPARRVLEMATVDGAKALGFDAGMLKAGAAADLIIVDMDRPHLTPAYDVASHLVYAASGADVRTTVVAGRVLMEDRRILTLDEDAVLDEVAALGRGLPFRS